MADTQKLLLEAQEKLSEIKSKMLDLLSASGKVNMTKQGIRDEIFKLYKELK